MKFLMVSIWTWMIGSGAPIVQKRKVNGWSNGTRLKRLTV